MKLIILSPPTILEGETDALSALFDAGLTHFHLRKHGIPSEQIRQYLAQIPLAYHHRIMLHSCHELAEEYDVKGIHFSSHQPFHPSIYPHLTRSIATHSFEEIQQLPSELDYAFISPIFDSISKGKYASKFTIPEIRDFFASWERKVELIALGGMDESRVKQVQELGFDGIATLGAIWDAFQAGGQGKMLEMFEGMILSFSS